MCTAMGCAPREFLELHVLIVFKSFMRSLIPLLLPYKLVDKLQPANYYQLTHLPFHNTTLSSSNFHTPPFKMDGQHDPIVIAVMGETGCGKSTFIKNLTQDNTIHIGTTLRSCMLTWLSITDLFFYRVCILILL